MKKFLCICEGGNVRSATLATILKDEYAVDALAAGYHRNSIETLNMLVAWADVVVCFDGVILRKYSDKAILFDIGPDAWGRASHPECIGIIREKIESIGLMK